VRGTCATVAPGTASKSGFMVARLATSSSYLITLTADKNSTLTNHVTSDVIGAVVVYVPNTWAKGWSGDLPCTPILQVRNLVYIGNYISDTPHSVTRSNLSLWSPHSSISFSFSSLIRSVARLASSLPCLATSLSLTASAASCSSHLPIPPKSLARRLISECLARSVLDDLRLFRESCGRPIVHHG
jgi:hypothetical protein